MLSKEGLLKKISLGETSGVEFKEVRFRNEKIQLSIDSLSDEIAAFANHQGGLILLGIENETNEIIGMDKETVKYIIQLISNICRNKIKPSLVDFYIDNVEVIDSMNEPKNLVYIEIDKSLWLHESKNGHYYRHGDSKRKMTTEHILRVGQSRSQARIIRFDEQAVPNTSIETLQKNLYNRFISSDNTTDDKTKLIKRNLLSKDISATVAGVLMCTNKPDEYLYNSFIQAVYYNGKIKDANYQIDAKDFKGTLDNQIIDAFKFVEKYNKISAIKNIGRQERPQYNMRAVFEAIVNAVVHRDYSKHGSKIRLFMFDDRLEIISPGALANTLTVETLSENQVTRNELLSRLLSELEVDDDVKVGRVYFLERRGEGVGIILSESMQLSGKKPIYEMIGEELKLTIFAANSIQATKL
ncbi:MAG: transcriptional regulator [Gammaproteobacteria bacterium]|nr:MAG: transcriptional regulator [Gammaproteobacteria bacterium]